MAALPVKVIRFCAFFARLPVSRRVGAKADLNPLWAITPAIRQERDPQIRARRCYWNPDVLYVSELVGPDEVNTMPEKTLHAFAGLAPGL